MTTGPPAGTEEAMGELALLPTIFGPPVLVPMGIGREDSPPELPAPGTTGVAAGADGAKVLAGLEAPVETARADEMAPEAALEATGTGLLGEATGGGGVAPEVLLLMMKLMFWHAEPAHF